MSGTFKEKLIIVLCIVIGITGVLLYNKLVIGKDSQDISIWVLKSEVKDDQKIEKSNTTELKIKRKGIPIDDIITKQDELTGKYAVEKIKAGSWVFKNDLKDKPSKVSYLYEINDDSISFKTDLEKCIGGIPEEGDIVSAWIYIKSANEKEQASDAKNPEGLTALKIIKIVNSSGTAIQKDTEAKDFSSSDRSKPAVITVLANKSQQAEIVKGVYDGIIHMALRPRNEDVRKESENLLKNYKSPPLEQKKDTVPKTDTQQQQPAANNGQQQNNNQAKPAGSNNTQNKPAAQNNGNGGFDLE